MSKCWLVGGAVRDMLLGREPKDRDYVVVGATPEEMIANGYEQVGADFPVFLKNGEEYALARKERKVGVGYNGFETEFDVSVTLEEDLLRRDLTINSIAYDAESGVFIDPCGGMEDLRNGVLRHTSEAFSEDPLRVLRVARFASRYSHFVVDNATMDLMKDMVKAGELASLTKERVVSEFEKAFSESDPMRFVSVLYLVGALKVVFPELSSIIGKMGGNEFLSWCQKLYELKDARERLAFVFSHFGFSDVRWIATQMKFPKEVAELAEDFIDFKCRYNMTAETTVELFDSFRVGHHPERFWKVFDMFNDVYPGYEKDEKRAVSMLIDYNLVTVSKYVDEVVHLKGSAIGKFIKDRRIEVIGQNHF